MKRYEIAKELDIAHSTVSRDIKYLAEQSQNYLNSLAKETLPFMYQTSIVDRYAKNLSKKLDSFSNGNDNYDDDADDDEL